MTRCANTVILFGGLLPHLACCQPTHGENKAMKNVNRDDLFKRSLLSPGNALRLQHVLAKARRGEPVTVGVIGGSITGGSSATSVEKRYGNRIAAWWSETFPNATVKFVNAGVGGTGSNYGCLRAHRDLLRHDPDFVVVEFGVNDSGAMAASLPTLEGLVRQILRLPNRPAAMLLFMMTSKQRDMPGVKEMAMPGARLPESGVVRGLNVQRWHRQIGEHYGLPMVSFRDAFWPEIEAGRLKWADVIADMVHPNDLGHEHAADFVVHLLEQIRKDLPADNELPEVAPLPAVRFSDRYEHVAYFSAEVLKPVMNDGWTLEEGDWHGQWWSCRRAGAAIEFKLEGTGLLAVLCVPPANMGIARFRVDDGPWQTQKGWHGQQWGDLVVPTDLADGLKSGRHTLRVEMTTDKDPNGDSFGFRIHALAAIGTNAEQGFPKRRWQWPKP